MKSYAGQGELAAGEDEADVVVVNSCTVTNSADSGVRNYINHARGLGKKVILAGCGAVSRGEELYKSGNVFGVLGGGKKSELFKFARAGERFFALGDLNFAETNTVASYENHTKAFLKIQEGCDFACSYCIIPSVRGKSRSVSEDLLLSEASNLISGGFTELVLTGTNIGSYGKDAGSSLGALLQKLGPLKGLKRVRLGSIEPAQIDEAFMEITAEPWLERHLHIALQHTSQKMLTIMRRRNRALKDLALFEDLASRGFALGTDFIVGHPGESEEVWEEALENFKRFPLTHLHAFVFSPREGTHSAQLTGRVNGEVAKNRLKTLKNIVLVNNFKFRTAHAKEPLFILVEERGKDGLYGGFDQFYNKIKIESNSNLNKKWLEINAYEVKADENRAQVQI